MTLTNRILLAMVGGILFGSIIELSLSWLDSQSKLYVFIQDGLVLGVFDVVGQIFIASLNHNFLNLLISMTL